MTLNQNAKLIWSVDIQNVRTFAFTHLLSSDIELIYVLVSQDLYNKINLSMMWAEAELNTFSSP